MCLIVVSFTRLAPLPTVCRKVPVGILSLATSRALGKFRGKKQSVDANSNPEDRVPEVTKQLFHLSYPFTTNGCQGSRCSYIGTILFQSVAPHIG